jgi:hypothetical protein
LRSVCNSDPEPVFQSGIDLKKKTGDRFFQRDRGSNLICKSIPEFSGTSLDRDRWCDCDLKIADRFENGCFAYNPPKQQVVGVQRLTRSSMPPWYRLRSYGLLSRSTRPKRRRSGKKVDIHQISCAVIEDGRGISSTWIYRGGIDIHGRVMRCGGVIATLS